MVGGGVFTGRHLAIIVARVQYERLTNLAEVIGAIGSHRGFFGFAKGRKDQTNKHRDDRYHDKKFHQRKRGGPSQTRK